MLQKWRLRVREGCHTVTERLTRSWCRELVSQSVLVLHNVGSSWEVLSLGFLQWTCLLVTFSTLTMNGEQILIGCQNSVGRRRTPQRDEGRGAFNILRWSLAFIVSLAGTPNSLEFFYKFGFFLPLSRPPGKGWVTSYTHTTCQTTKGVTDFWVPSSEISILLPSNPRAFQPFPARGWVERTIRWLTGCLLLWRSSGPHFLMTRCLTTRRSLKFYPFPHGKWAESL